MLVLRWPLASDARVRNFQGSVNTLPVMYYFLSISPRQGRFHRQEGDERRAGGKVEGLTLRQRTRGLHAQERPRLRLEAGDELVGPVLGDAGAALQAVRPAAELGVDREPTLRAVQAERVALRLFVAFRVDPEARLAPVGRSRGRAEGGAVAALVAEVADVEDLDLLVDRERPRVPVDELAPAHGERGQRELQGSGRVGVVGPVRADG